MNSFSLGSTSPSLFITSVDVSEASPYAVVVAYLSNPSTEAISCSPFLKGITASSGIDFSPNLQFFDQEAGETGEWVDIDPVNGINFSPGSIEIKLRFAIYLDQVTEGPETVLLVTGPIKGKVANKGGAEGKITILDSAAYVSILSIVTDTGFSPSDFITNDTTLIVKGINALLGHDEKIQIRVSGEAKWHDVTQLTPSSWAFDDTANPRQGEIVYEVRIIYENEYVGNTSKQVVFIDTSAPDVGVLDITTATDTGADDNITANGNPILTFSGEAGLEITVNGAAGQPLASSEFSVSFNGGIYTVSLLDAEPVKPGLQPFGSFSGGNATNNAVNVADGTYTINAEDIAGNTKTVGDFIIDTAIDEDGDGADDNFEQGQDGNNDGIPDIEQSTVATFETSNGGIATISVTVVDKSSSPDGSLQASTAMNFQGVSANAQTSGDIITGLEQAAGQKVNAVSDQISFLIYEQVVVSGPVDPVTQAAFTNSVNQRFSDTIQQVDIYFEESAQVWNSIFKPDGNGGYFFFDYDPQTGLGGILLDRNNNSIVDGARLFLKDGEFGDLDGQRNAEIQDPIGLAALVASPTLLLSDDNLGLVVEGSTGTGLWLNIDALLASASWQNTLELVTRDGAQLGSIGATANSTNLGSKEIYLEAGQELRFTQSSGNENNNINPNIRLSSVNGGFSLLLEDGGGNDSDFNDLVLQISSSLIAQDSNNIVMARLQLDSSEALLNLSTIPATGTKLNFSILTDSGYNNRFGLVRLDVDSITGGYSVNGIAAGNSDAFRSAVRDNLINPGGSAITAGGQTETTTTWDLTTADQGIYAAVLINPNGQVFTFGATASDGQQHVKVLGDSTFGFEDLLASQSSDWDFNDFKVQVSFAV